MRPAGRRLPMSGLNDRTDSNLINLFKSLKESNIVPTKQALNLATDFMNRLFGNSVSEEVNSTDDLQELILIDNEDECEMTMVLYGWRMEMI